MTIKSRQKIKYLENEKSFQGDTKSNFFIIFKGLLVVKNDLKPESVPWSNNDYICTPFLISNTFRSNARLKLPKNYLFDLWFMIFLNFIVFYYNTFTNHLKMRTKVFKNICKWLKYKPWMFLFAFWKRKYIRRRTIVVYFSKYSSLLVYLYIYISISISLYL